MECKKQIETIADSLAVVKSGTLEDKLNDVEAEALVNTLADRGGGEDTLPNSC